jgi:pentatricopeptide repeat protein
MTQTPDVPPVQTRSTTPFQVSRPPTVTLTLRLLHALGYPVPQRLVTHGVAAGHLIQGRMYTTLFMFLHEQPLERVCERPGTLGAPLDEQLSLLLAFGLPLRAMPLDGPGHTVFCGVQRSGPARAYRPLYVEQGRVEDALDAYRQAHFNGFTPWFELLRSLGQFQVVPGRWDTVPLQDLDQRPRRPLVNSGSPELLPLPPSQQDHCQSGPEA